ncbi:hypothetical protein J4O15_13890 [Lachnoanaerobaculum sp. Marseille-Q4761]|nr:hypothetical protein [uncultured Lachnoanaerobaculum sp.]MBO1871987.1 hypothetical protein [Lachnoanaerobaculum sp. Marseille-Q4761]RKW53604.1 MAG: hypothetical protein D8H95_12215 [Lachnospiraceae bacterium]
MRAKKFRYIIFVFVFLLAVIGFLLYSFLGKEKNETIGGDIEGSDLNIPKLYNVLDDYYINKMYGYSNEMDAAVSDNILSLVLDDFSMKFRIVDADISEIEDFDYSIRKFDTNELVESGERTKVESDIIDLHLSSLMEENKEYSLELKLYTNGKTYHYYSRIIRSNTEFLKKLIDMANTFSNNNFDSNTARDNSVYLESDGTGNSRGLEYVTLKSDFEMISYNGMSLTPAEKEVTLVNYNGKVGEIHFSFTADAYGKTYNIEENFICKSGAQRLYMLDYTRTMNQKILNKLTVDKKIDLGMGNRGSRIITNAKVDKIAFLADNKLFLSDGKKENVDVIYSCGKNNYIMPLKFGDGLYFINYGYNLDDSHIGEVGVCLLKYMEDTKKVSKLAFIKTDVDVASLKESIDELAYMGDSGMLYIKLLDKVVGLDITSGSYVTVAENLETGKYSISQDKSLLSWNVGDGLNIYNFAVGENKQLDNANEVMLPIGYIGSDLVVAIQSQNISNTVNGKSVGSIFEKISIYNNLLELQKEYTYDGRYIDNINVSGNRVHIELYQYDGENFTRLGEDTIISSKSVASESRLSSYADSYRGKNYVIDYTKKIDREISYSKTLEIEASDLEYDIELNTSYLKNMYYVYINSKLKGIYDDPVRAVEDAYTDMGFVRRNGIMIYVRAMVDTASNINFEASAAGEYVNYWENNELTRFRGITLKEAMYFLTIKKPVFTFTAINNPVILTGYDSKTVTIYDINTSSIQKIDINEAQSIFNSTQNDFSCFFTFGM